MGGGSCIVCRGVGNGVDSRLLLIGKQIVGSSGDQETYGIGWEKGVDPSFQNKQRRKTSKDEIQGSFTAFRMTTQDGDDRQG
jgi:hypothetical protein